MGHKIGFRHTDYFNVNYSCPWTGDEGISGTGAVHIPGTPISEDPNSWMLACSDGWDRPFNANDIQALNFLYGQVTETGPSAISRTALKTYVEQVTTADASVYNLKDNLGRAMDCLKIIENPPGGYLAIYHSYVSGSFRVNIATSTNLINWTWVRELATGAEQPTISVASDGGFITVWEQAPTSNLKVSYYNSWNNLRDGIVANTFTAPHTMSPCSEGTPNIYSASSTQVDIGFHYGLGPNCGPDRQARGTLTNFNSWRTVQQQYLNNAILHWTGQNSNVRDRDITAYNGFHFALMEGQNDINDFGSKRTYLYDFQTGNAQLLNIATNNGSTAFANPTITNLTIDGQPAILVTLFIPSEGAASGESGQLLYYKKY